MTDILHITDRERTQAAVILALESARDEMAKRIEALTADLAARAHAPTMDAIYAAWHGAGVDIAGGDWARFAGMLAAAPQDKP